MQAAIAAVAPEGIDMYFENVGGMHFEAAFQSLRAHGRIAVCGGISQYNYATANPVSFNPLQMIYTFQVTSTTVIWGNACCISWLVHVINFYICFSIYALMSGSKYSIKYLLF